MENKASRDAKTIAAILIAVVCCGTLAAAAFYPADYWFDLLTGAIFISIELWRFFNAGY